jgi:hypothetical protein
MTERSAPSDDVPGYELRLEGHLDARWATWFDGLTLTHGTDGTTSLRGPVVDQAALHGLLHKIRDLGVPLISVIQTEPDQPDVSTTEQR